MSGGGLTALTDHGGRKFINTTYTFDDFKQMLVTNKYNFYEVEFESKVDDYVNPMFKEQNENERNQLLNTDTCVLKKVTAALEAYHRTRLIVRNRRDSALYQIKYPPIPIERLQYDLANIKKENAHNEKYYTDRYKLLKLNSRIFNLKRDFFKLKCKIFKLKSENDGLKSENDGLTSENAGLKFELDACQNSLERNQIEFGEIHEHLCQILKDALIDRETLYNNAMNVALTDVGYPNKHKATMISHAITTCKYNMDKVKDQLTNIITLIYDDYKVNNKVYCIKYNQPNDSVPRVQFVTFGFDRTDAVIDPDKIADKFITDVISGDFINKEIDIKLREIYFNIYNKYNKKYGYQSIINGFLGKEISYLTEAEVEAKFQAKGTAIVTYTDIPKVKTTIPEISDAATFLSTYTTSNEPMPIKTKLYRQYFVISFKC